MRYTLLGVPYDGDDFDVVVLGRPDDGHGNGNLAGELAAVKSVLLYANSVTVESHRPAFLHARILNQIRTVKTRLGPVFESLDAVGRADLLRRVQDEVRARRPELARDLALPDDPALLLELPDIFVELMQEHGAVEEPAKFFRAINELAVQRWVEFKPDERPAAAIDAVRDLNRLVDAGLVLLDPGPVESLWTVPEADLSQELARVLGRVLSQINGPGRGHVPLFDDRAVQVADASGGAAAAQARSEAAQVRVAARLLGGLPNLAHLPIDELLDVRTQVEPHVGRFRAAVAELEGQLDPGLREADFDAAVAEIRKLRVEPELEALTETLRGDRLLPTLARAFPLTGSGVVGLAVTTIAGAPTLAAAAAVAVGVGAATAKEYLRREDREADRMKNRLFLLHRAAQAGGR